MIGIVDYGVGNLYSLQSSLRHIGADCVVTNQKQVLADVDSIILPGVGAFGDAIEKLRRNGLDQVVYREAKKGKPLLGICLGMQLLYEASQEYGLHAGLGLVHGQITDLSKSMTGRNCKVPHMGWNQLQILRDCPLLRYSKEGEYVYYVHSFFAMETAETAAVSDYGGIRVTGVVQNENVFGAQFHPEKSGDVGLRILRAFSEIKG